MPRHRLPHRRWAPVIVSLLLGASLACGAVSGGAATPAPTPAQPTGAAATRAPATPAMTEAPPTAAATATATPVPINTQPGELTFEDGVVFGSGPFSYGDLTAGLAELASYQAELTVSFAGTRAGQVEEWTKTYVMLASGVPSARQWTITTTGAAPDAGDVFVAELEGADYERRGEAACTATAVEPSHALTTRLELAALLPAVNGADEAGAETLNGVATSHYTFDQRALGEDGLTEATGELWVAAQGGYLIQYGLSRAAGADYFGEGLEGTLTLTYTLTGINQPVTIDLPADCPPGLVPAPLLPDAANVVNVPGLLAFETAATLADASAFYQAQLPSLGWTLDGDPAVTDTATVLLYTQGDQQLTVSLRAEAGQTTVDIVLARLTE